MFPPLGQNFNLGALGGYGGQMPTFGSQPPMRLGGLGGPPPSMFGGQPPVAQPGLYGGGAPVANPIMHQPMQPPQQMFGGQPPMANPGLYGGLSALGGFGQQPPRNIGLGAMRGMYR
jgi:hypothetical protein